LLLKYFKHVIKLLFGKQYNDGIPEGSRFATHKFLKKTAKSWQETTEGQEKIKKVRELSKIAKEGESTVFSFSSLLSVVTDLVSRTQYNPHRPRPRMDRQTAADVDRYPRCVKPSAGY